MGAGAHSSLDFLDAETRLRHLAVRTGIAKAIRAYQPEPLAVVLHLLVATQEIRADPSIAWAKLLEKMRVSRIVATHYAIVTEPQVLALASQIELALFSGQDDRYQQKVYA